MVEETVSPLRVTSFLVVTKLVFSQSCELALAPGLPGPASYRGGKLRGVRKYLGRGQSD